MNSPITSTTAGLAIAVSCGAAIGALARVGVSAVMVFADRWPGVAHADVWITLVINVLGCFLFGIARTRIDTSSSLWAFIGPGVLGGFTTFSTFILLIGAQSVVVAVASIVATLVCCPLAVWLGSATS